MIGDILDGQIASTGNSAPRGNGGICLLRRRTISEQLASSAVQSDCTEVAAEPQFLARFPARSAGVRPAAHPNIVMSTDFGIAKAGRGDMPYS